ncbi:MAG: pyruvate, phosphate dikinase [Gemmatimonadetes bacterium]|nr:pyruvate, phosphate dikinase [Gemmatimonadota bacterium]
MTAASERSKLVYFFGAGQAEGDRGMRDRLGGKGANLAEMTGMGIPVPPGFTISTEVCTVFMESGGQYPAELRPEVDEAFARMEQLLGRRFGDEERPLMVSVRSGAAVSMPGMMDTVLNLGLNDRTVEGLARDSGNPRFALDAYRRLLQMYGDVVLGIPHDRFERPLAAAKEAAGVEHDSQLGEGPLRALVREFLEIIRRGGRTFPQEPHDQLWGAIAAVFTSWGSRRATHYRRKCGIPDTLGTAVNVQGMVFGNLGEDSATGVAFTRDPSTGVCELYGEYLVNAQGEDVVAGIRTPHPIRRNGDGTSLEERMPGTFSELAQVCDRLERHYRDIQDLEFTVERGRLWLLQTRTGKRSAAAAVRSAVEMVAEGLIDEATAVGRIDPGQLQTLLHPSIDESASFEVLATGLAASPGAASGQVVFTADEAAELGEAGEQVVLVRRETSPEDIHGMTAAQAILTARGGTTSHAAVVARGMGKCCVAGCKEIDILPDGSAFSVGAVTVRKGDWITLDGSTGRVILGRVATRPSELQGEFRTVMEWCDRFRRLGVRANADTPHDARQAIEFGAEGIGLCRTEHMFFDEERILLVRRMIFAASNSARRAAIDGLRPLQRGDFADIFRAMGGRPVTIRLLDPPLHEFLPHEGDDLSPVAAGLGVSTSELRSTIARLAEANPMLGHRGCRLGITYPEITEMQARAMGEAACDVAAEGVEVALEVMVPLVGVARELALQAAVIRRVIDEVLAERGAELGYTIGTMIELPRACVTADEIAREAQFFSFGTNDLTQTVFGLSRDDSGKFLQVYLDEAIYPADPFAVLDEAGVGRLIRMAVELGRSARPDLKVGICGEHGGDPASVAFCHRAGLDYVSCSPFRVPVARLAAAQAALAESGDAGRRVAEERLAAR